MKHKIAIMLTLAITCIGALAGCGTSSSGKDKFSKMEGNGKDYLVLDSEVNQNSMIKDKRIAMLGSSSLNGYASQGKALAEYVETVYSCKVTKAVAEDDATMTTTSEDSYIQHMKDDLDVEADYDMLLCQIPVQDSDKGVTMGTISEDENAENQDTDTILGAMEYIINYAQKNWECPVFFYTNSLYDNDAYGKITDQFPALKNKYPYLGICNMWAEDGKYIVFNGITDDERKLYTYDDIHLTQAGYREWWGPKLGRELDSYARKLYAEGNSESYDMAKLSKMEQSPLDGKTICALGSSVTYGEASFQQAVGEYLAARFGATLTKEAVSGTTLADFDDTSYVSRMEDNLDTNASYDLFVVQLSTNDASQKIELGEVSDSTELTSFDTQTVTGAIEYIINYVDQTWGCPVVFYTGTQYKSEDYAKMVQQILTLKEKYSNLIVLDLFSDASFNNISDEERTLYMSDPIHPTRAGYKEWWGPELEKQLLNAIK